MTAVPDATTPDLTAKRAGYIGCNVCGRANARRSRRCVRCGAALLPGGRKSPGAVWAWLIAGMIFYIPANYYPMLVTSQFGKRSDSTIVGGAFDLAHHGAYAIAGIVLVASVVIPIAKFWVIARLMVAAQGLRAMPAHTALRLYEVVEFIGRWSMIDVFVVAILAALVQMGFLASLSPGPAAAFFALSVASTMMSARALDPRLIWDRIENEQDQTI